MDNTNGKKYFKAEEKRSLNLQVGWMVVEPLRYIFGPRALENLKEEALKKLIFARIFSRNAFESKKWLVWKIDER